MNARKKNDTGSPITATLTANGAAVDLTGSTVTLTMVNSITGAVKINAAACTIVSPTAGTVSYQPTAANMDTCGHYKLEFKQVRPDTTIQHFPSSGYELLTIEESLS